MALYPWHCVQTRKFLVPDWNSRPSPLQVGQTFIGYRDGHNHQPITTTNKTSKPVNAS